MTQSSPQPSPLSETSLTRLLSVLREQHTGAPSVAPLITRVADPSFRRAAPTALSAAVNGVQEAPQSITASDAGSAEQRRVLIPVNLSGLLGVAGSGSR